MAEISVTLGVLKDTEMIVSLMFLLNLLVYSLQKPDESWFYNELSEIKLRCRPSCSICGESWKITRLWYIVTIWRKLSFSFYQDDGSEPVDVHVEWITVHICDPALVCAISLYSKEPGAYGCSVDYHKIGIVLFRLDEWEVACWQLW